MKTVNAITKAAILALGLLIGSPSWAAYGIEETVTGSSNIPSGWVPIHLRSVEQRKGRHVVMPVVTLTIKNLNGAPTGTTLEVLNFATIPSGWITTHERSTVERKGIVPKTTCTIKKVEANPEGGEEK